MGSISAKLASRIIIGLLVALVLGGIIVQRSCTQALTAKTESRLSKGQAGAALESGADSVSTVGNRMTADQTTDAITRENENAIKKADGADAPVASGVRDAGLASLCRRAAHRRDPKCVQLANPR